MGGAECSNAIRDKRLLRMYKHLRTGEVISKEAFESLPYYRQDEYEKQDPDSSSLIVSGLIGYATNSGLLGGILGGSLVGGVLGDALKDEDDSPFW